MRRIALLVAHLHRFDAVANDTQGIKEFFAKQGFAARIFAPSGDPGTHFEHTSNIKKFIKDKRDVVLLAYAGHWPLGEALFADLPGTKILRYHNVTPASFYAPYDPETARLCELGRMGLPGLLANAPIDLFLPVSQFNAKDLLWAKANKERLFVLPVFHQIEELLSSLPSSFLQEQSFSSLPIFPSTRELSLVALQELFPEDTHLFMMIGRLVPSKGWENFLRTAHFYIKYFNKNTVFVMTGSPFPRLGKYYRKLEALSLHLGLGDHLLRLRHLDAKQLAFLYKRADAFLLCSEHEGFCVPLVESMAFGLPVVALNRGAIAETAADTALLWQDFGADVMATSLHRLKTDASLQRTLKTRGKKRYESVFRNSVVAKKLRQILSKTGLQSM